jgi:hypothetical protein
MPIDTANFADASIVKFFPSSIPMETSLQQLILKDIHIFLSNWKAHGSELFATAFFINTHVLAVVINDSVTLPSGCSLDSLYKKIIVLENQYNVSLNDRNFIYFKNPTNQKINCVPFFNAVDYHKSNPQDLILNLMSKNIEELNASFELPPINSPYKNLILG